MNVKERQALATRLVTSESLDPAVRADLDSLKPIDRYEVIAELASMSFTGSRPQSDGRGFLEALPYFLREDCFKGQKPKLIAERLGNLIRAARKLAADHGEAKVLAELIRLAASVSIEAKSAHVDAENVIAAARTARPSIGALARVPPLQIMGFAEMALWGRLGSIAASGDLGPDDAVPLADAIRNLFAERGTASNVVPVELRTLHRSLVREGQTSTSVEAPAPVKFDVLVDRDVRRAGEPPKVSEAPKITPEPKNSPDLLPADLLALLESAIQIARSDKETGAAATKAHLAEVEKLREKMLTAKSALEDERGGRRSAEEKLSALERDLESRKAEVDRLKRDGEDALRRLGVAEREVERLVENKMQLELVIEGSRAAALKVLQKSFRDEAVPPLGDLADYVRQASAAELQDLGRLERSFERFSKIITRLMMPEGDGTGRAS